jgi:hypothetical protein
VQYCSPVKIARHRMAESPEHHLNMDVSATSPRDSSSRSHSPVLSLYNTNNCYNNMSKLQQTQTHSFNSDNSNKQALAQVSSGQQLVDSEESGVCMQCSIFGDDYIASKFKWFSPQLNPESMNNVCPRSFDVVGECPVCATANSTRKSKINWKSIYEINLSSAVPLIKELPASKHGSDSDRLLLGARTWNLKVLI